MSHAVDPYASSKRRAWTALVLGAAGVATMPTAVILAHRSHTFAILDASYAVPLAFVLGVLALSLALMGALSVGFYEGLRYYQHHH